MSTEPVSLAVGCFAADCDRWATAEHLGIAHCLDHLDEARMLADDIAEAHLAVSQSPLHARVGGHVEIDCAYWTDGFHVFDVEPSGVRHWIGNVERLDDRWFWCDVDMASTGDWRFCSTAWA